MSLMSKTQLMQLVAEGKCRECFTFIPDDGTPERRYDVSLLRGQIRARLVPWRTTTLMLDCLVPFLSVNRVWEQSRVDALNPDSYELDPPIALQDGDTVILVDGVHRIMRLHQSGHTTVKIVFVDEAKAPRVSPGWGQNPGHDWGVPLSSLRAK